MTKLLIYLGEGEKFDFDQVVLAITSIRGVANPRSGDFIGALFECDYHLGNRETIVRVSKSLETVTVEGEGDESLSFALEFQSRIPATLLMTNLSYGFNLALDSCSSLDELRRAMSGSGP